MYKLVDDTFINTWNQGHSSVNPSWIVRLQTQLAEAVPAYIECSEEQAVEIRVTQHWLKATVWQLSFCHGLIGNVPNEPCFTVMYLINKSRDLLSMAQQFAQHAMEIHGAGLVSFFLQTCSFSTPRPSMSSSYHQVRLDYDGLRAKSLLQLHSNFKGCHPLIPIAPLTFVNACVLAHMWTSPQ
jgi:hypothetical protein